MCNEVAYCAAVKRGELCPKEAPIHTYIYALHAPGERHMLLYADALTSRVKAIELAQASGSNGPWSWTDVGLDRDEPGRLLDGNNHYTGYAVRARVLL